MPSVPNIHTIEAAARRGGGLRDAIERTVDAGRDLVARHRLVRDLTTRTIRDRYRASHLGLLWAFLNPLILLTVYTIVFASVLRGRFGFEVTRSPYEFGVILFASLIPYNFFVETLAAAPLLIVGHVSYVKRVVFPVHALPLVGTLANLVHAGASLILFVVAALVIIGRVPATIVWLPLVWLPLVTVALGVSYLLAALGVFLRDLGQVIGPLLTSLFFISPVFYTAASMPEILRPTYRFNPLGVVIENTRRILVMGMVPERRLLALWGVTGLLMLVAGFAAFVRCRRAFNDVL